MSGGDFVNSGERQRLLQRGIEDRLTLVRQLRRIMDVHGAEAAALMLGSFGSGELFAIVERRQAVQAPLLEQMFGPRGSKLREGLTTRTEPKGFVTVPLGGASKLGTVAPVPVLPGVGVVAVEEPGPIPSANGKGDAVTPPWRPNASEVAELKAILARAIAALGGAEPAGAAMGLARSTVRNLKGGHCPWSRNAAAMVWAWDAANPVAAIAPAVPEIVVVAAAPDAAPDIADAAAPDGVADRGVVAAEEAPALPPAPESVAAAALPLAAPTSSPEVDAVAVAVAVAEGEVGVACERPQPPRTAIADTAIAETDWRVPVLAIIDARAAAMIAAREQHLAMAREFEDEIAGLDALMATLEGLAA